MGSIIIRRKRKCCIFSPDICGLDILHRMTNGLHGHKGMKHFLKTEKKAIDNCKQTIKER